MSSDIGFHAVGYIRREDYVSIVRMNLIIRLAMRTMPTAKAIADNMMTSISSLWMRKADDMDARNIPM